MRNVWKFGDHKIEDLTRKKMLQLLKFYPNPVSENIWCRQFNTIFHQQFWKLPFISTKETRLIVLQWKVLHNIYPTGTLLHKMKINPTDLCKFCDARDTPLHFFFECKAVTQLWKEIESIILLKTNCKISLSAKDVILGVLPNKDTIKQYICKINLLILIGKLVISKGKYGKVANFKSILENELILRKIHQN